MVNTLRDRPKFRVVIEGARVVPHWCRSTPVLSVAVPTVVGHWMSTRAQTLSSLQFTTSTIYMTQPQTSVRPYLYRSMYVNKGLRTHCTSCSVEVVGYHGWLPCTKHQHNMNNMRIGTVCTRTTLLWLPPMGFFLGWREKAAFNPLKVHSPSPLPNWVVLHAVSSLPPTKQKPWPIK